MQVREVALAYSEYRVLRACWACAPYVAAVLAVLVSSSPTVDQITEAADLRAQINRRLLAAAEIAQPVPPIPVNFIGKDFFDKRQRLLEGALQLGHDERTSETTPKLLLASYGGAAAAFSADPGADPAAGDEAGTQNVLSEPHWPAVNRRNKGNRMVLSVKRGYVLRADPRTGRIIKIALQPPVAPQQQVAAAPSPAASPKPTILDEAKSDRGNGRATIMAEQQKRDLQCLAKAIYFEARGESEDGQLAVAQVVMNRVEHWFYPDNICDVVFQNQHRRNKCQFSFACDGRSDQPLNKVAWSRAMTLAKKVIIGKVQSKAVGDSTHYHANYVRPRWIRDMIKIRTIGKHIFYKVRAWS